MLLTSHSYGELWKLVIVFVISYLIENDYHKIIYDYFVRKEIVEKHECIRIESMLNEKEKRINAPIEYIAISKIVSEINHKNISVTILSLGEQRSKIHKLTIDNDVLIDEDIYIRTNNYRNESHALVISTKKHNKSYINDFIEKCVKKYDEICNGERNKYIRTILCSKVFKGDEDVYSYLMTEDETKRIKNENAFDNIIGNSSKRIKDELTVFRDNDFFIRNNLKRKIGYLFYGPPGTGKSLTVKAIANFLGRVIVEAHLVEFQSAHDVKNFFHNHMYNGMNFKTKDVVYLFEEIDYFFKKCATKTKHGYEISYGDEIINSLLTELDGVSTEEDMIVIATTNNIEIINKALIRPGRLTPILFDVMSTNDVDEMLTRFYGIGKLPEKCGSVSPAMISSLRLWCKTRDECVQKIDSI